MIVDACSSKQIIDKLAVQQVKTKVLQATYTST